MREWMEYDEEPDEEICNFCFADLGIGKVYIIRDPKGEMPPKNMCSHCFQNYETTLYH